jgi:hypothetical protein
MRISIAQEAECFKKSENPEQIDFPRTGQNVSV